MRRLAVGAALALLVPARVGAHPTLGLGAGGWVLERYGGDIAVLRTLPGSAGRDASLMLSCSGTDHRLRVVLPMRETRRREARAGEPNGPATSTAPMLIRAAGGAGPTVLARSARRAADGTVTLLVAGARGADGDDPVLTLARLLSARPGALDLLADVPTLTDVPAIEPGPRTLWRPALVRLALTSGPGDDLAFRDFVTTCAGSRP